MNFKEMNDDQKNLYGILDLLVSAKIFTGKSISWFITELINENRFDQTFDLGWFRACGIRAFHLACF